MSGPTDAPKAPKRSPLGAHKAFKRLLKALRKRAASETNAANATPFPGDLLDGFPKGEWRDSAAAALAAANGPEGRAESRRLADELVSALAEAERLAAGGCVADATFVASAALARADAPWGGCRHVLTLACPAPHEGGSCRCPSNGPSVCLHLHFAAEEGGKEEPWLRDAQPWLLDAFLRIPAMPEEEEEEDEDCAGR